MSKIGYIEASYGKTLNISIANTYSYNVLNGSNLPINSLIIASNTDEYGNDTGTYSMLATDNVGDAVRLTYTIKEGNGLYYDSYTDALSMHTDNDFIDGRNGTLKLDISDHLSYNFKQNGDDLDIDTDTLPDASQDIYGTAMIDGITIKSDEGRIRVDTEQLMYGDNSTGQYGTAIGDGDTVISENGILSVNTAGLDTATEDNYGMVMPDNNTFKIEEGILSVNTDGLLLATYDRFGVAKADNNTIVFNTDGEITVNEARMLTADSINPGLAMIDDVSVGLTNNDKIYFKDRNRIYDEINNYMALTTKFEAKLKEYKDMLADGNVMFRGKDIHMFTVNETATTELVKPHDNEEIINMPLQTVSAVFTILTTCDFKASILFEDGTNEFPNVDILEVNYNDEVIYDKEKALNPDTVYKSTNGERKKFIVRFTAKNYRNSIEGEYVVTSVFIRVSNAEDMLKYHEEKYSIVRYNALYNSILKKNKGDKDKFNKEFYVLDPNSVYWRESN